MSMSRAELYGESIFTSFRSCNGRVPQLSDHIKRVFTGVNSYYFNNRLTFDQFNSQFLNPLNIKSVISKNPNHYFRITLFSNSKDGLTPINFSMSDLEVDFSVKPLPKNSGPKKLCIRKSPFTEDYIPIKSGSYFQNFLLKQQARLNNFDDALFERDGYITEATTSNIIFGKKNKFYSPNAKGILEGLCLKLFEKYCLKNDLEFELAVIKTNELSSFDTVLLANSVGLLTPVELIDQNYFNIKNAVTIAESFEKFVYNGKDE